MTGDGRGLLVGGWDGRLQYIDLRTGRTLFEKENAHEGARVVMPGVTAVAIAPDGRHALSAGKERILRYWRLPRLPD